MAGADAVTVASLSASIAEVRDNISQASQVVGNMKIEFQNMVNTLEQKFDSQGQTLGAAEQVLRSEVQNIRVAVESFTQSYDPNGPAKIVELYEQAKDQHIKTEAIQQAANTIYIYIYRCRVC